MKFIEVAKKENIKDTFLKLEESSPNTLSSLVETALSHSVSLNEVISMLEVAPPGKKAEKWIKDRKNDFKEKYGKDWQKVLYATAWKRFGESNDLEEATTKDDLESELKVYPTELVDYFRDKDTFTGFMSDNRKIGRLVNKLLDTTSFAAGPIMRVAEHIKEYNRLNGVSALGNSDKARRAARSDRILRVRDSSGKATARKF